MWVVTDISSANLNGGNANYTAFKNNGFFFIPTSGAHTRHRVSVRVGAVRVRTDRAVVDAGRADAVPRRAASRRSERHAQGRRGCAARQQLAAEAARARRCRRSSPFRNTARLSEAGSTTLPASYPDSHRHPIERGCQRRKRGRRGPAQDRAAVIVLRAVARTLERGRRHPVDDAAFVRADAVHGVYAIGSACAPVERNDASRIRQPSLRAIPPRLCSGVPAIATTSSSPSTRADTSLNAIAGADPGGIGAATAGGCEGGGSGPGVWITCVGDAGLTSCRQVRAGAAATSTMNSRRGSRPVINVRLPNTRCNTVSVV